MNSGKFTETGRFDRWFLILIFTTPLSSYFAKVSVRIDLQTFGCALPSILAPILAMLCRKVSETKKILNRRLARISVWDSESFILDIIQYNNRPTTECLNDPFCPVDEENFWGYNDYLPHFNKSPDIGALIIYFLILGLGSLALGLLTSYIWNNESWTYPLERNRI